MLLCVVGRTIGNRFGVEYGAAAVPWSPNVLPFGRNEQLIVEYVIVVGSRCRRLSLSPLVVVVACCLVACRCRRLSLSPLAVVEGHSLGQRVR